MLVIRTREIEPTAKCGVAPLRVTSLASLRGLLADTAAQVTATEIETGMTIVHRAHTATVVRAVRNAEITVIHMLTIEMREAIPARDTTSAEMTETASR